VLGFSAVQQAYDAPEGQLDLRELVARDLLTVAPARTPEVPGDETERAALGYLHANCSHCRNQQRPPHEGGRCFDPQNAFDFSLPAAAVPSPADTPAYRTGAGSAFIPGAPDESLLIDRVSDRGGRFVPNMPPLGTERVHEDGVALLRRWIAGMKR
jgi:hypothetical protein